MAEKRYYVIGHCALITQDGPMGRAKLMLMRGNIIGPGMTDLERDHNLAGQLIAEVPGDEPVGIDAAGVPVSGTERLTGGGEPGSPEGATPVATPPETPVDDTVASPLPPDGSAPPQNASKATWVEYAVSKGMDRTESAKSSKADLIAALKS